jgi:MscS family membrane protein
MFLKLRHLSAILSLFIVLSLVACSGTPILSGQITPTSEAPSTPTPNDDGPTVAILVDTPASAGDSEGDSNQQILSTPTPEPTATPGALEEAVSDIAIATGLDRQVILGLTGEDWVNLAISLLIGLLGLFVVLRLLHLLLRAIVRATKTHYNEVVFLAIGRQVGWLAAVWIINYSTNRLLFLSAEFKQSLNQLYYTAYVVILTIMVWKAIDLALQWYQGRFAETHQDQGPGQNLLLPVLRRVILALLVVIAGTIILNNYGINVTALVAVLGLGGLALTLAAQDTLSDTINGFLLIFDRPFRIGDRIEIQELNTWGDVVEIGARTTRIRTRDNRLVVVPNSKIGKSQVINYSYPDPQVRLQTQVKVAYDSDVEAVCRLIQETVRGVEGILKEREIDVLLVELGDSALILQVRWWIDSYVHTSPTIDRVHRTLLKALDEAGVDLPYNTQDVHLKLGAQEMRLLARGMKFGDDVDSGP